MLCLPKNFFFSHRPININNVYVEESVHVYMRWEEIEMLPKLDDILVSFKYYNI